MLCRHSHRIQRIHSQLDATPYIVTNMSFIFNSIQMFIIGTKHIMFHILRFFQQPWNNILYISCRASFSYKDFHACMTFFPCFFIRSTFMFRHDSGFHICLQIFSCKPRRMSINDHSPAQTEFFQYFRIS